MSVIKELGKWYIRGKYKLENGKYKYYHKVAKNCTYKSDAKEYERKFLLNINNEIEANAYMNFSQLSSLYIDNAKRTNKEVTILTDINCLHVINENLGDKKINLLYKKTIQKFIDNCDEKYSQSYTSKIYYTINKILTFGVVNEYILFSPMNKVILPTHKGEIKKEMEYWTYEQFNSFITRVEVKQIYYVMFNFLYYMGCRKGEMLALQWNDIDFSSGKVKINKTVSFKNSDCVWKLTTPKTNNSIRSIVMPNILFSIMNAWKDNQEKIIDFNGERFVFGFDRPFAPENLRRYLSKEILRINKEYSLDLPMIRVHDFRHSHASYLISRKLYDYDVARRLGDTVTTIHDVYAHWFDNAEEDILKAMNDDFDNS